MTQTSMTEEKHRYVSDEGTTLRLCFCVMWTDSHSVSLYITVRTCYIVFNVILHVIYHKGAFVL